MSFVFTKNCFAIAVSKKLEHTDGMSIIMDVREGNFSEKSLFSQGERLMKNDSIIEDS